MAKGISEDDVHAAADALLAEGLRPTIERLRQRLGRGSPNTVNRYVDSWWKGLSDRVKGGAKGQMPADIVRLAGRLWASALAQARLEVARSAQGAAASPGDLIESLEARLTDLRRLLEGGPATHVSRPSRKRPKRPRRK